MEVTPAPPPPRFTTRLRVRYAETDAAGVVYYGNYLTYFEVVRVELLRALGHPITTILEQRRHPAGGRGAPQVPASGAPGRPARGLRERRVRRPGVVRVRLRESRASGLLLVTGWTRLAVCERDTGRAMPMPAWLRDLFASLPRTVQT